MNESFSDPDNLEKISLSRDPLSFSRELSKKNLEGNILVSGYGGGTANTEFESLTNISMEPLASNISTPYIQMSTLMDRTPNTISYFKDRNYKATAIHPYKNTLYKRKDVYSALGFDEFIYDKTMQNSKKYESNSYISDHSGYEEVLYQLKNTDEKDFIHLVTMHGHQTYEGNYNNLMFKIEEKNNEENKTIEQYYQGLSYSDQDLKYLIEKIDQLDEETLLVFWGDHLPGIYTDEIFTKENKIDKFETPVLFYSNFKNKEVEGEMGTISPFYFMNYISDILNHPISGYTAFMKELENEIAAFEKGRYVESKSQKVFENRDELNAGAQILLEKYDILLYDLFEGKQQAIDLGFFETP